MKKALLKILSYYSKIKFSKNALMGKKVFVGPKAKIINGSGNPEDIVIGDRVSFYGTIETSSRGRVILGRNTTVRFATLIESANSITIGNEVIISNNVIISDNDSHPTDPDVRRKMSMSDHEGPLWSWDFSKSTPITIEDNVWIGRKVMIMKGVTIGKGSIVASGTVLTKDIPPYSLCYGNPCIIKAGKYSKS